VKTINKEIIHDYYLELLDALEQNDKIMQFEEWKRRNGKRLRNISGREKDIFLIWQKEEIIGKKKKEKRIQKHIKEDKNPTCFYPIKEDLQNLPQNTTLIKILFNLKKPYTSKDEGEFHVIDHMGDNNVIFENPIVRDKFTGLPMVRPSTWKGHLRFAAEKVDYKESRKKKIIIRLFGSEPEGESALKGRLYFFPTFFLEDAKKDIITPLKRDTRTPARGSLPFEVIEPNRNKQGIFYLLYFPYPKDDRFNEEEIKEDLELLSAAIELMFYTYGFSAKKTSGFGVIEENLNEGKVWKNIEGGIYEFSFSNLENLSNQILGDNE